ncbi:MAG: hypothetical protein M1813_008500 [Trichoglossum hirsutum]|nr:MAG: hypothetical protein M1813_008500 [Trichoglossum hirsutum]
MRHRWEARVNTLLVIGPLAAKGYTRDPPTEDVDTTRAVAGGRAVESKHSLVCRASVPGMQRVRRLRRILWSASISSITKLRVRVDVVVDVDGGYPPPPGAAPEIYDTFDPPWRGEDSIAIQLACCGPSPLRGESSESVQLGRFFGASSLSLHTQHYS